MTSRSEVPSIAEIQRWARDSLERVASTLDGDGHFVSIQAFWTFDGERKIMYGDGEQFAKVVKLMLPLSIGVGSVYAYCVINAVITGRDKGTVNRDAVIRDVLKGRKSAAIAEADVKECVMVLTGNREEFVIDFHDVIREDGKVSLGITESGDPAGEEFFSNLKKACDHNRGSRSLDEVSPGAVNC